MSEWFWFSVFPLQASRDRAIPSGVADRTWPEQNIIPFHPLPHRDEVSPALAEGWWLSLRYGVRAAHSLKCNAWFLVKKEEVLRDNQHIRTKKKGKEIRLSRNSEKGRSKRLNRIFGQRLSNKKARKSEHSPYILGGGGRSGGRTSIFIHALTLIHKHSQKRLQHARFDSQQHARGQGLEFAEQNRGENGRGFRVWENTRASYGCRPQVRPWRSPPSLSDDGGQWRPTMRVPWFFFKLRSSFFNKTLSFFYIFFQSNVSTIWGKYNKKCKYKIENDKKNATLTISFRQIEIVN